MLHVYLHYGFYISSPTASFSSQVLIDIIINRKLTIEFEKNEQTLHIIICLASIIILENLVYCKMSEETGF
jgi:hypothetical protein